MCKIEAHGLIPGSNPKTCAISLHEWVKQEQAPDTQVFPEPELADWTFLGQISLVYNDDHLTSTIVSDFSG